jgi:hypothetical protein
MPGDVLEEGSCQVARFLAAGRIRMQCRLGQQRVVDRILLARVAQTKRKIEKYNGVMLLELTGTLRWQQPGHLGAASERQQPAAVQSPCSSAVCTAGKTR